MHGVVDHIPFVNGQMKIPWVRFTGASGDRLATFDPRFVPSTAAGVDIESTSGGEVRTQRLHVDATKAATKWTSNGEIKIDGCTT